MKSANFLVIFLLLVFNAFGIETGIKGIVKDQISGEPLAGAHLVITKYNLSTISSDDGTFYFTGPFEGDVKIECSYLGYQPAKQNISVLKDQLVAIEISLQPTIYSSNEVVITASRSTDGIKQIPARINVITRAEIENSPHEAVEDILKYSAGINVLSPGGIYSIRPVITLRGLGGDEQGRTLILVDGIPLNKGDTGGVNWARLNSEDIERIEVFHGPGSSIYGNNAMGGVINIITRKPTQKIEGSTRLSYGTYNTLLSSAHIGGYYKNGMYFRLSGMYNTSDGYNDKPDELREDPDYSVPRFFDEYNISTKAGWNLNPFFNVEFQYDHYRNKKSDGEKIEAPDGEYRRFDTDFLSAKLQGSTGKFSYSLHTFSNTKNILS